MTMVKLKERNKPSWTPPNHTIKSVKKSLPFLEAFRGQYTHRVRYVDMHTNYKGVSWFAIQTWCGASFKNGSKDGKGQTYFAEKPTNNRPICATCEGRFIGSGMNGDRKINGQEVMYRGC